MPITFPLDLPEASGPVSVEWMPLAAVMRTRQDIALGSYSGAHDGKNWVIEVNVPPLPYELAVQWQTWFLKLNGPQGTFFFQDPVLRVAAGEAEGWVNAKLNGDDQEGNQINTDGWPVSTAILKAGDWIAFDNLLHLVLLDADSNVSGQAVLVVWPSLNGTIPDNTLVQVGSAAFGLFHLAEIPSWVTDVEHFLGGFSFRAEQEKTGVQTTFLEGGDDWDGWESGSEMELVSEGGDDWTGWEDDGT